jgi:hypothetical protein
MGTDITSMALRQQYSTRFNHIARLQNEALASGLDPKDLDMTKTRYSAADTAEAFLPRVEMVRIALIFAFLHSTFSFSM